MAADQRRKLLNGASTAACASSEQYKIKKKKLKSLQNDLIAKSHISLEWDGNHKKVVAKKEQVGISWRHLRPFLVSSPRYHNVLADVFTLPREIFELDDLTQVISYEAWKTHLSENERNLLMQFLPKGTDREQILQTLLAGENFHFGNPFLQWSASLCSGHLHPDAVISHEQCLKADKKAYYSELQKYHDEIIGHLQKLKENWKSYEDPETEIAQNIWRSRRDPEKRTLSCVNESRLADTEQDASATSESCSWNADEKACTSDNQNSSVVKGVEFQKRIYKKGIIKDKHRTPLITSDDVLNKEAKPRRGDKLQKRNIQQSDGVKYMSYIKISKKQHELVKSMKQSGKSIQSRSLNRVLGNLNSFHVQPYEVFMEEEKIKLHEHWLKLARQDLPVAYGNWRDVHLLKREIIKSLNLDLHDNLSAVLQDGKKSAKISQHQEENGVNSKVLDEEKENSNCVFQDQKDNEPTESESYMQDSGESRPGSSRNQSCQQLSINSSYLCSHMDLDSVKSHHISKLDAASSDASEYSGNLKAADVPVNQGVHLSSAEDVWPGHGALHSYQDSTAGREYSAVSGLSLTHQQTNENQRSQLINLDSSLAEEDTRKVLLHGQSDGGSFSSFPNQHRHELLQSLLKDERMLSYNHEQKPTGLDFQSPKNVFTGNGRFPGHFQEQLQPSLALEQGQKRQNEIYMQQHISPNIYSDGGRYVIPRQELLPSGNMADWTVNPVRMPASYQQQLNSGDLFSQNWFPSEHQVQVRNGWSGSDGVSVSNQGIGSAASNSNADQSLFSVLSQCNQLRSGNPYGSMHTTEQFISAMPRNYGMVGSGNSAMSNNLAQASHPLDYLGGRDAATSLMADDMGWMNLTHQNPGLHDPMGKPYLRSWNQ